MFMNVRIGLAININLSTEGIPGDNLRTGILNSKPLN